MYETRKIVSWSFRMQLTMPLHANHMNSRFVSVLTISAA
jgi:hypothetical protein